MSQSTATPGDAALFHGCPRCPQTKGPDDVYTAGKFERGACHTHSNTWPIGTNLTSQWREELERVGGDWDLMIKNQRDRYAEIDGYADVSTPHAA